MTGKQHRDGSWEEHILAFELYSRIPFGRQHSRTPEFIEPAKIVRRSPHSVAMKLKNIARLDPELKTRGIKRLSRGSVIGLAIPESLISSHIVPWAVDAKQHMNPRNGLCLNALRDRAFDRGLMFIDHAMTVRFPRKNHPLRKTKPRLGLVVEL